MILEELCKLYDRLLNAGENVPQKGRKLQKISFRVILNMEGKRFKIENNLGNDKKPSVLMVLGEKDHSSKVEPFFLFDKAEYMLGYGAGREKYFPEFQKCHLAVEGKINCPQYSAVCRFLEQWDPNTKENKSELEKHKELFSKGNGVFVIEGEHKHVHELESVQHWWDHGGKEVWQNEETRRGQCLVSGEENAIIARLHEPVINDIASLGIDAQAKAVMVSFKEDSFSSYGEEKGYNAPVSKDVVFKYCNALKYLISHEDNRVIFWETQKKDKKTKEEKKPKANIFVFWCDSPREKDNDIESLFGHSFGGKKAQDNNNLNKLEQSLREISQGKKPSNGFETPTDTRFFILGISPNSARLSIRFWQESTVEDFVEKLRKHYEALKLVPEFNNNPDEIMITPYKILRESVGRYKIEEGKKKIEEGKICSHDVGSLMNSILQGSPYPDTLAIAMTNRIKADGEINHIRCAYLKAWLSRKNNSPIEIQYMLNKEETNPAYLLGRLFAVLEKTQQAVRSEEVRELKRTVKDSFFASASVTPAVVFPRMMRLYVHHLAKLSKQEGKEGLAKYYDKLIQDIVNKIERYPRVLNLMEQGVFTLGYYHQKQDLYTKKDTKNENSEKE